MEVIVNGICHLAAKPEDCAEGVCARTHMSHASEVLEACILFLQRIAHRVASAVNRYGFGFYLNGLSASHGLDQLALYAYAGTRADFGKDTLGLLVLVNNYLYVLDCRLRAMNAISLFPLFVLTQPFARTSSPALVSSSSLTFLRSTSILVLDF